jgi:aldehyde:ferredoxin oxidoreductase
MYGWAGTILTIDLTKEQVIKEPLDTATAEKFLGSDGFGVKLLWDRVPAGAHPLDPANIFCIGSGPLTGTFVPNSGKVTAIFKSPTTGLIGVSTAGGFFGPELKEAGYDLICLMGKAKKPVWIWIEDDKVEIRDAAHMWGKTTWEAIDIIHEEVGDVPTVTIGPAGETQNFGAFALVMHSRALGGVGSGAVMGSKNVKAIAARGTKGVKVYNPDEFLKKCKEVKDKIMSNPVYAGFAKYGTPQWSPVLIAQGVVPTRNFREGVFPEGEKFLDPETPCKEVFVKSDACEGCVIHCGHWCEVRSGPYKGTKTEGLEWYAEYVFGPLMGCADWGFITKASVECNSLGIGFGQASMIAWLMDLYDRGMISKKDVDGLDLTWGNQEAILKLLRKMAYREGVGDILAQGWEKAAERFGGKELQPIITRLVTTECPRARMDIALSHITSVRGGDHNKSLPYWGWTCTPEFIRKKWPEWPKETADIYSPIGKPEIVDYAENWKLVNDALSICYWSTSVVQPGGTEPEDYAELLTYATGVKWDSKKLLEVGRRVTVLERAFNVREGWGRDVYQISPMFIDTAFPSGPQAGVKADMKVINDMVDKFLERKGFDSKTGYPKKKTLEELGLDFAVKQLKKAQKLIE